MDHDVEQRVAALDPTPASDPAWALTFESVPWNNAPEVTMSRRQRLASRGSYNVATPPYIAELGVVLDPEIAAESVEASLAITRFDEAMSRRLNMAEGDELSPLDAVLLRTESASSSQIEQITANARSLALAAIGEDTGPNARLVVNNSSSMRAALAMAETTDAATIIDAHAALLNDSAPHYTGQFRNDPVWIGGSGSTPHAADFVPPQAHRVPALVDDLVRFIHRIDVAPLSQAAIAHAQFETIHPFPDGNGRVGRVLVHAMLRNAQVTRRMTLPVSSGLLADIDGYYEALNAYRAGDLNPIVAEFSQASFRSIDNGRVLVEDLSAMNDNWRERVHARSDAAVWRALAVVISQPAVTIAYLAEQMGISTTAAERAIHQMVDAEILVSLNARRRNRVWTAPEVTDALDAFAKRAGRRSFRRG